MFCKIVKTLSISQNNKLKNKPQNHNQNLSKPQPINKI